MMGDLFRFYWSWLKRTFSGWFKRVEGWASTVALLFAVVLLIVPRSPEVERVASAAPAIFFVAVFGLVVAARLMLAPYWLYREERAAREALERAREPSLVLSLPDPPVINSIALRGTTHESLGGTRQTVITGLEMDVVALVCANTGGSVAKGCRARILSASRAAADGEQDLCITESVELPWRKEDPEGALATDIAPADKRRIWIGGVRSGGHLWLFRDVKSLPLEYQQLLGAPGTYRVVIQVDGENVPPQQILMEIVAAEGPKPENGVWRGVATASVVAQGAPTITADLATDALAAVA